ncbi:MAG: hypothetical protein EA378_02465 [Phycisphaerales bacterium]|nr:MAG: hypothetical protein EA378_02465 [Phycisphaerales bacterium]
MRLRSVTDPGRVLSPPLPTAVVVRRDTRSADIYLTDLSRRDLDPLADLSLVSGHIVHIHMFLHPSAGRTPIDSAATNATIRHMIVARGAVGVYEGAGFVLPRLSASADTFHARIRDASLRLMRRDPGFTDPLGAVTFDASIRATEDPALARLIARRFEREAQRLPSLRASENEAEQPDE